MTTLDPRFLGTIGRAHPEYVPQDTLDNATAALLECACGNEHRKLRLAVREAVEELEHANHHGCAETVRKTLWKQ